VIRLRDIEMRFGPVTALTLPALDLERGERLGVRGHNGCGKSTLLRILAGLLVPTRGVVEGVPRPGRAVLLHQRPYLFRGTARDNVAYARRGITETGFEVIESPTAICPIIVGDTARAIAMSNRLLEMGVFVIGFGYPVVPEGTARLRVQISAAHEQAHLDQLIECLGTLKREMG